MGLDTYSSRRDLNWIGIDLRHGFVHEANGAASFRGKVYSDFIEAVTNESLYQETIPNATVKDIAKKLILYVQVNDAKSSKKWCKEQIIDRIPTWDEVKSLTKWFKVVANGGAEVNGRWYTYI
ncbi:hypothetical protein H8D85_02385 [bacterium]|nr:hypothetical protein [bacterium]